MTVPGWSLRWSRASHPTLTRYAEFFCDPTDGSAGQAFARMLGLDPGALLAQPAVFDWVLPTDWAVGPASDAPQLTTAEAKQLLGEASLRPQLTAAYLKWLGLHDLVLDHHGWLFEGGRPSAESRQFRQRLLDEPMWGGRALRFLALSGLEGYSRSGIPVATLAYSAGLLEWLDKFWQSKHSCGQHPPHSWRSALQLTPDAR